MKVLTVDIGGTFIKNGINDVGPPSAHIDGMDYAVFTEEKDIADPKPEFFSPKEGDLSDYVAIRLASRKRITMTNSCAAIALGSTEVKTTDLLKECTEEEAGTLAAEDLQAKPTEIELVGRTRHFYAYNMKNKDKTPLRILDKKGFIRVQRNDGAVVLTNAGAYRSVVTKMWDDLAAF